MKNFWLALLGLLAGHGIYRFAARRYPHRLCKYRKVCEHMDEECRDCRGMRG